MLPRDCTGQADAVGWSHTLGDPASSLDSDSKGKMKRGASLPRPTADTGTSNGCHRGGAVLLLSCGEQQPWISNSQTSCAPCPRPCVLRAKTRAAAGTPCPSGQCGTCEVTGTPTRSCSPPVTTSPKASVSAREGLFPVRGLCRPGLCSTRLFHAGPQADRAAPRGMRSRTRRIRATGNHQRLLQSCSEVSRASGGQ